MKNIKITVDLNFIVDLEEERKGTPFAKEMITAWINNKIDIAVVAISASERRKDRRFANSFEEFKKRLKLLHLDEIKILKPMGYWGITFWDYCLLVSEEMIELERKIHNILFPNISFDFPYNSKEEEINKWKNAKCDVQYVWTHIWYNRDVFITSDRNFHKQSKLPKLIELGVKHVETPESFVKKFLRI